MHRLFVSAAILVALTGTAVHAEEGTVRIRLGDLNLQQQDDARVALRRIKSAATAFCNEDIVSPIEFSRSVQSCRRDVVDKAVGQLNAPLVTAIYAPTTRPTQLARR